MQYMQSFIELKDSGRLPSPNGVGLEILRLTQNEDCCASDIAEVLKADAALTGRILQLANSAASGATRPVTTVNEATVRLGMRTVRNVALGFSLVSAHRTGTCEAFDYELCWGESLARATVTQVLSKQMRVGVPAEVFVCGLLSKIGSLALATVHPDTYAEILKSWSGRLHELLAAEEKAFSINQTQVMMSLLHQWGLPDKIIQAIVDIDNGRVKVHDPERENPGLPELLQISHSFAAAYSRGEDCPVRMEETTALLNTFSKWDEKNLEPLWDDAGAAWSRWGKLLGIHTASVAGLHKGKQEVQQAATGSAQVLVVSTNPEVMGPIHQELSEEGYAISTSTDVEVGLREALKHNPRIVLVDQEIEDGDGLQFCRVLRQSRVGQGMFLILMTRDEELAEQAFDEGIDDVVFKPIKQRHLKTRVKAGLRVTQIRESVEESSRREMAELSVQNRQLQRDSMTDALTMLPNRRYAERRLNVLWQRSEEQSKTFSVAMVDIDHFKSFNDTYGHDVGDVVLKTTAQSLQGVLRWDDIVCRLGGEEFLIIVPAPLDVAVQCAERLRAAVEQNEVNTENFKGHVTASFGCAERVAQMTDPEELLKAADEALYEAKKNGRNRVCAATHVVQPLNS